MKASTRIEPCMNSVGPSMATEPSATTARVPRARTTNTNAAASVAKVSTSWIGRRWRCGQERLDEHGDDRRAEHDQDRRERRYSIVGTLERTPVAARMALTAVAPSATGATGGAGSVASTAS